MVGTFNHHTISQELRKPDVKQDLRSNHSYTHSLFPNPKEMAYRGEPLIPLETPERHSQTPMDGVLEITVENILNSPHWLKVSLLVRTSPQHLY